MRSYNAFYGTFLTDLVTEDEYTPSAVLAKLLGVDGPGSGLDADTLDGEHASSFESAGTADAAVAIHESASDPHTQYETQARADARYSQLGHTHAGVYELVLPAGTILDVPVGSVAGTIPFDGSDLLRSFYPTIQALFESTIRWIVGTTPSVAWWFLAWNGTVYCAIAPGVNYCITSPDGLVWTQHTLPATVNWRCIRAIGTAFLAVAEGTTSAISYDNGVTWTQHAVPNATWHMSVAYNGSSICGAAWGSSVAFSSPDGVTFTQRALPVSGNWQTMSVLGATFCAFNQTNKTAAKSTDNGVTWSAVTLPFLLPFSASSSKSGILCVMSGANLFCFYTGDLISWSIGQLPYIGSWSNLSVVGDLFFSLDQNSSLAITSKDCKHWTVRELPANMVAQAVIGNGNSICCAGNGVSLIGNIDSDYFYIPKVLSKVPGNEICIKY